MVAVWAVCWIVGEPLTDLGDFLLEVGVGHDGRIKDFVEGTRLTGDAGGAGTGDGGRAALGDDGGCLLGGLFEWMCG